MKNLKSKISYLSVKTMMRWQKTENFLRYDKFHQNCFIIFLNNQIFNKVLFQSSSKLLNESENELED